MKSAKYHTPEQIQHFSDKKLPVQEQAEQNCEPIISEEEALRAQFELEDQVYQRFKSPLYAAFFDLCSK